MSVKEVSPSAPPGDRIIPAEKSEGILSNSLDTRYVLRNVYHNAESYFDNGDLRIFRRKTNLPRVIVEIPDGYTPIYILNNKSPVEISEKIEFASPGVKEIEIGLMRK